MKEILKSKNLRNTSKIKYNDYDKYKEIEKNDWQKKVIRTKVRIG